MFIELLAALSGLLLSVAIVRIFHGMAQQYQANRYFQKVSPKLPVPKELMSLFGGHVRKIVFAYHNVFIIDELHKKYGKTFGHYYNNKPFVCTTDLELIKALVVDNPWQNLNRHEMRVPLDEFCHDTLPSAPPQQWRRIRQAFAPAMSLHKLKSSPNVLADVQEVITQLKEAFEWRLSNSSSEEAKSGVIIDTSEFFHRFTLSLIYTCFYKQHNSVDFKAKSDRLVNLTYIAEKNLINPALVWTTIFPSLMKTIEWAIMTLPNAQGTIRRQIMNFIKEQTRQNMEARKDLERAKKAAEDSGRPFDEDNFKLKDGTTFRRNLLDPAIDKFHEKKLTKREFYNSAFFLFFAAYKTFTDASVLLLNQLALNPELQEKLRESIRRDGEESEYLDWCIHESIRVYPPVTLGCSRIIESDYVGKDGILIPKGTQILTSAYTIHRSKEIWGEDAEEFKPERWAKAKEFHPCQYLGFGLGPRNCPGKYFALYSLKKLIIELLSEYRFRESVESPKVSMKFAAPVFIYLVFEKHFHLKLERLKESERISTSN